MKQILAALLCVVIGSVASSAVAEESRNSKDGSKPALLLEYKEGSCTAPIPVKFASVLKEEYNAWVINNPRWCVLKETPIRLGGYHN